VEWSSEPKFCRSTSSHQDRSRSLFRSTVAAHCPSTFGLGIRMSERDCRNVTADLPQNWFWGASQPSSKLCRLHDQVHRSRIAELRDLELCRRDNRGPSGTGGTYRAEWQIVYDPASNSMFESDTAGTSTVLLFGRTFWSKPGTNDTAWTTLSMGDSTTGYLSASACNGFCGYPGAPDSILSSSTPKTHPPRCRQRFVNALSNWYAIVVRLQRLCREFS
jgi:hypothetical protein